MTKFYVVEPEVAGGLGSETVSSRGPSGHRIISRLHYELDGWLGDHLLETTPCFIATKQLADRLLEAGLSGFSTDLVEVSTSEQFRDLYGDRPIPQFIWLKVGGQPGVADLAVAPDLRLIVSAAALELLKSVGLEHAEVAPFPT
jgi:hypothetical protein